MDWKPYAPPVALDLEWGDASRDGYPLKVSRVASLCLVASFCCGFIGANQILALGRPFGGWLIAGLPCTPGWMEAIHAISHIARLYPLFLAVCIFLGYVRTSRAWLLSTMSLTLGFAAHLIWTTCIGSFPSEIVSIHPAPAGRFVTATLHGLSHVFLIPIGFLIGELLRRRAIPRIRPAEYVVIAVLLVIWVLAIIEPKTTFQHAWIRWLSFVTLIIFAARSAPQWCEPFSQVVFGKGRANGRAGTLASAGARESGGIEAEHLPRLPRDA